jgi:hypothetical protein
VTDLNLTKGDPAEQFWRHIEHASADTLGPTHGPIHFHPMAPHLDRANALIGFMPRPLQIWLWQPARAGMRICPLRDEETIDQTCSL